MEVDRVVQIWPDPLDIAGQGHGVLVGRELAVAAAATAREPVLPDGQLGRIEGHVQEEGQLGVKTRLDQPFQQSPRVGAHASRGAGPLQRPHVQQHGRATAALPR